MEAYNDKKLFGTFLHFKPFTSNLKLQGAMKHFSTTLYHTQLASNVDKRKLRRWEKKIIFIDLVDDVFLLD